MDEKYQELTEELYEAIQAWIWVVNLSGRPLKQEQMAAELDEICRAIIRDHLEDGVKYGISMQVQMTDGVTSTEVLVTNDGTVFL